jgi:hypothetical protein
MPAAGLNSGCRHGTFITMWGFVAAYRLQSRTGSRIDKLKIE